MTIIEKLGNIEPIRYAAAGTSRDPKGPTPISIPQIASVDVPNSPHHAWIRWAQTQLTPTLE